MNFARPRPWAGSVSTEVLCARILERHRDVVRVRKPSVAVANLTRIVDATLKLSNKQGFHATSLRDLAKVSGLSVGGLYSYFDNKTTLLSMILGETAATVTEVLSRPPDDVTDDARAHLEWVIDTHVRLSEAMQPWFVFAFMEAKIVSPGGAQDRRRQRGCDRRDNCRCDRARRRQRRLRGSRSRTYGLAHQTAAARLVRQTRQISKARHVDRGLHRGGDGLHREGGDGEGAGAGGGRVVTPEHRTAGWSSAASAISTPLAPTDAAQLRSADSEAWTRGGLRPRSEEMAATSARTSGPQEGKTR